MQTAHHPEARFRTPDDLIAHYKAVNERIRTAGVRHSEREKAAQEAKRRHERAALTLATEAALAAMEARSAAERETAFRQSLSAVKPSGRSLAKMVMHTVACAHGVTLSEVLSDSQTARIVAARQDAMRKVKAAVPGISLAELGRLFNRHHTTVLHALQKEAAE